MQSQGPPKKPCGSCGTSATSSTSGTSYTPSSTVPGSVPAQTPGASFGEYQSPKGGSRKSRKSRRNRKHKKSRRVR